MKLLKALLRTPSFALGMGLFLCTLLLSILGR